MIDMAFPSNIHACPQRGLRDRNHAAPPTPTTGVVIVVGHMYCLFGTMYMLCCRGDIPQVQVLRCNTQGPPTQGTTMCHACFAVESRLMRSNKLADLSQVGYWYGTNEILI
jgi:hypothetical protein